MKYYVLSAVQGDNYPISLIGNAILFESAKSVNVDAEYSYFPWYSIEEYIDCKLPENGVLLLNDSNLKITLRKLSYNIYVVNDEIKAIFEKYLNINFHEVSLVDKNSNQITNNKYYIFKLNIHLDYGEVFDMNKTFYRFSDDLLILEKSYSSKDLNENVFKIIDIDPAQDSIFISEKVKIELDVISNKGFNIFEISSAKWRDPDDFMNNLFLDDELLELLVWPI